MNRLLAREQKELVKRLNDMAKELDYIQKSYRDSDDSEGPRLGEEIGGILVDMQEMHMDIIELSRMIEQGEFPE